MFEHPGDPLTTAPHAVPAPALQHTATSGYVSRSRPAPTTFDDRVWVILPHISPDRPYGPCGFPKIHGNTKPGQGTPVMVLFDQDNVPEIVWWEGAHS